MTHEQLEAIRKNAEEASGLPFTAFSISQAVEKDIPALLAEVERLRKESNGYRSALRKIVDGEVDSLGDAFRLAKGAL